MLKYHANDYGTPMVMGLQTMEYNRLHDAAADAFDGNRITAKDNADASNGDG